MAAAVAAGSLTCSRAKPPHARILSIRPTWWVLRGVKTEAGVEYRRSMAPCARQATHAAGFIPVDVSSMGEPVANCNDISMAGQVKRESRKFAAAHIASEPFRLKQALHGIKACFDAPVPVNPHPAAAATVCQPTQSPGSHREGLTPGVESKRPLRSIDHFKRASSLYVGLWMHHEARANATVRMRPFSESIAVGRTRHSSEKS